jgi:membrane-associated phospholipid phosphatase
MAIMGAIGLGVYMARPAPTRNFPVTFKDGEIVYPEFAYPLRKNIVPIWLAAFLAFFIPAVVIMIMQIRVRSFWDINNSIMGLLYSLITAAVFQVFLKWLIGGLRPHFLAVCKPDVSKIPGQGYGSIMFNRNICTGDEKEINDSLESFPSGHSTAAFAGFVFLFLYMNAKMKLWSNYHPAYWKMIATYAPLLGATLIASSLTIDEYHNWYDCFAGACIGTICAFGAYRMVYVAIWDWRYNHIPLPRGMGFGGQGGYGGFEHAVFTRKGGWGTEEGFGHHHHGTGHHGHHTWGRQREYSGATAAPMAPGPERV